VLVQQRGDLHAFQVCQQERHVIDSFNLESLEDLVYHASILNRPANPERRKKVSERQAGKLVFTGPKMPPAPNERPAVKDTAIAYPGEVTRIIAKFNLPSGARVGPGQRSRYVFHCHILEHEDQEMMRPFEVVS
jgi:FtsP/CotA-like multicopper oxidase with cupredoxin domain